MVGFLGITLAVLIALALLSYSPHDSSFNVASQAPESHPARNWIGPAGAYGADILFQVFGYAAFLLPMGICVLGLRWFRSHPLDSAVATLVGYAVIAFFLRYLQTRTLKIFVVYRFAFGIFILLLMFLHRGTAR
jgi:S-DNA-T family DNA segregation ATPase FtsK/SpoIIIE